MKVWWQFSVTLDVSRFSGILERAVLVVLMVLLLVLRSSSSFGYGSPCVMF